MATPPRPEATGHWHVRRWRHTFPNAGWAIYDRDGSVALWVWRHDTAMTLARRLAIAEERQDVAWLREVAA